MITDLLDGQFPVTAFGREVAYHEKGRIDSGFLAPVPWPEPLTSKPPKVPSWFAPVAARLREVARLPNGWNGAAARQVSPSVLRLTVRVLAAVTPPRASAPHILPRQDGGLQIEWHEGGGDVELAVHPDGYVEVSAEDYVTGEEIDGGLGDVQDEVVVLMRRMTERQS